MDQSTEVGCMVQMDKYIIIAVQTKEDLQTTADFKKNVFLEGEASETIGIKGYVGTNITWEEQNMEGVLLKNPELMLTIKVAHSFEESLMSLITSTIFKSLMFRVHETLYKGETLVIDSNLFTAYKDDENILDNYEGDWIQLSRDLESLTITYSNQVPMEGKIIFRERFL